MAIAAFIPVAHMAVANAALAALGRGAQCFSVPVYAQASATHAALHAWGDPVFEAQIKALANVTWSDVEGLPSDRIAAALPPGAQWAGNITPLEGQVG